MNLAVVLAASVASGQGWDFELSDPILGFPGASTTVTLHVDPGPADYAFAGANLAVHASEEGWSDPIALIRRTAAPPSAQNPGTIMGASVTDISIGQLTCVLGFCPDPGRIPAWRALFTISDSRQRLIDLRTETSRFLVYTDSSTSVRRPLIPAEAAGRIEVIPAPGAFVLLGLGGLASTRRRRPEAVASRERRL